MKRFFSLLLASVCALTVYAQKPVTITNNSDAAFTDAVVDIPWPAVLSAFPKADTSQLQVLLGGKAIPYQFERKGTTAVQNLLVQLSVAPKQTVTLTFRKGKPAPVTAKTYCRYVPERYDDFAWENDKVAFRIYGKALNGRSDNAYGSDIWAKRTDQLILNKWYKQNDYHKDHGEGLDYYHVGLTLGAGDIGVFLNDSIQFVHNYQTWEVLDNGPLRSTFRVTYAPYVFKGVTVNTTKTISLDAGSQLSKIVVAMQHTYGKPLPLVAGITLRPEPGQLLLNEQAGILAYWEPQHNKDGTIGVGCVFTKGSVPMRRQYQHGLAQVSIPSGETVTYYSGGAWDKGGQITSGQAWMAYLHSFSQQLQTPLLVQVNP
nr:DUF4861 family protein [uncultured Arsenicibacter sp.]